MTVSLFIQIRIIFWFIQPWVMPVFMYRNYIDDLAPCFFTVGDQRWIKSFVFLNLRCLRDASIYFDLEQNDKKAKKGRHPLRCRNILLYLPR